MALNRHGILKNMGVAFLAQGISMALAALQTLVMPKVLGVDQFSWWQLYLFYVSYVGFFHFGLSSGVYLEMGGISREDMDKSAVKSMFLFGVFFQGALGITISFMSLAVPMEQERKFAIIAAAAYIVLQNAATYMMNVLQCMNETGKSSTSTIVERIAYLVPLVALMVAGVQNFRPFVWAYTASTMAQLVYCGWHLRDFAYAKWLGLREAAKLGFHSISVGISLMLANVASMLVLGAARFVIDMRWGIEVFGRLSLMLSLVTFFLAFVNQAGMVLFPVLRQGTADEVKSFYISARDALSLIFPVAYLAYFPMSWVLVRWLPAYADAMVWFALLLPVCVFDSKMTITGTTYFNVLRRERTMLTLNIAAAVASMVIAVAGAFVADSIEVVIVGVVVVIVTRSLVAEWYLSHELGVGMTPLTVWELMLTVAFVAAQRTFSSSIALATYALVYVFYLLIFRGKLVEVRRRLAR